MDVVGDVARQLRQAGIRELFGVLGAGNLEFVTCAVHEQGIRYHALRHESAAVAAADTFARLSGSVGVATVTHGPGLTHASSAIVEAAKSGVPLLVVTSSVGGAAVHQNQALDQVSLVRVLGATPFTLGRSADVHQTVRRAISHATSRGPVVLILTPEEVMEPPAVTPNTTSVEEPVAPASLSRDELTSAAQALTSAERPVILIGRGAAQAECIALLREIGQHVGALLFTTLAAKDRFADDEYGAGMLGAFGDPAMTDLAATADVVLVVGSSLSSWTVPEGILFSRAAVIRCDRDTATAGRGESIFLRGDAMSIVRELSLQIGPTGSPGYRTEDVLALVRASRRRRVDDMSDDTGLDPRIVVRMLGKLLPRKRVIVVDGGHFSGWPAMFVSTPPPGAFVYAHGYQCVGLALGNVVGAAIAEPAGLPVAFIGDGGLLMSLGELHAIVDLGVPVLVVVINDGAYGAEFHQAGAGGAELTTLRRQDFASLAGTLGGTGILVKRMDDLRQVASWLEAPAGLCIVDCHVTRAVRAAWLGGK